MAIIVSKKGVQVKANGKYHSLENIINGLPETEEERLIEEGICTRILSSTVYQETDEDTDPNSDPDADEDPDTDEETYEDTDPAPDAKVTPGKTNKASGSKRNKKDAELADLPEETGPETSHPLA